MGGKCLRFGRQGVERYKLHIGGVGWYLVFILDAKVLKIDGN